MKTILITGSKGFIGRNLVKQLTEFEITELNRDVLDLSDNAKLIDFLKDKHFDVVIHTASSGGSRLRQDSILDYHNNVDMFNNLMAYSNHFDKLITFSSGAEFNYDEINFYGQSKRFISGKLKNIQKSYNLRIYGCFGEDELDTRFIKSTIRNYINKENIVINQNKRMDFMYIDDLVMSVRYLIQMDFPKRDMDMCYRTKYYLSDIAEYINKLNKEYSVNIVVKDNSLGVDYVGNNCQLPIHWNGLFNGIQKIYNTVIEENKNE